ncbi:MAG: DUF1800 domain-containing protein [Gammaproteobacteria bacterium]|nr:DUF1800 domain-containing protein [Gammaproteobacteria bacterium]
MPPAPAPAPTTAELNASSLLAAQATFGMPYEGIEAMARTGNEPWLDAQFAMPVTRHTPIVNDLVTRRSAGEFSNFEQDIEFLIFFRRFGWWHNTITADDVLRQRVAFALSEIMVVSDNVDALIINPYALTNYYDMLLRNSFGNFRDLLTDVTLHPAMGIYLSHVNNRKSDAVNNTFPDENFAREVMQLFSIGLFELNIDGSLQTDGNGQPIPTYSNTEIREFAKMFTGLSYGGPGSSFGNQNPVFQAPMVMFDAFHEPGEKRLLNGLVVPAGQTGDQDIEAAIDNLFNHPNVGPFIGKQLIQRLVTSNPSPEYVERVARVFNGDVSGVRGDLQAVIRAVLLDVEASNPPTPANGGKLREPIVRYAAMIRQFNATSTDGFFFNTGYYVQNVLRQHPLSSPSVFNFFLPAHSPSGELSDASLVAPEFQITTSTTIANMTNVVDFAVNGGFVMDAPDPPFGTVTLDMSDYVAVAGDVDALLDRLNIVVLHGGLSDATRAAIRGVLVDIADLQFRAQTAIYLLLVSPDYAVQT